MTRKLRDPEVEIVEGEVFDRLVEDLARDLGPECPDDSVIARALLAARDRCRTDGISLKQLLVYLEETT